MTWATFSMFPSFDGSVRGFSHPEKDDDLDSTSWLGFLDRCGIKEGYIYPTVALISDLIQDRDWAVAIIRAYNQLVYNSYMKATPRLKPLALIPIQDIPAAVSELRRAVTELGMVGAALSSVAVFEKHYDHRDYNPVYEEAQRLGLALTIHGTVSQKLGIDQSDNFFKTQTLEHPLSLLIQFTDMMADGVFERYPDLRVTFLESEGS